MKEARCRHSLAALEVHAEGLGFERSDQDADEERNRNDIRDRDDLIDGGSLQHSFHDHVM